jgi:nucleoside-diphosphate-sugar epimerase
MKILVTGATGYIGAPPQKRCEAAVMASQAWRARTTAPVIFGFN